MSLWRTRSFIEIDPSWVIFCKNGIFGRTKLWQQFVFQAQIQFVLGTQIVVRAWCDRKCHFWRNEHEKPQETIVAFHVRSAQGPACPKTFLRSCIKNWACVLQLLSFINILGFVWARSAWLRQVPPQLYFSDQLARKRYFLSWKKNSGQYEQLAFFFLLLW